MNKSLKRYTIDEFITHSGAKYNNLTISYQIFGRELNSSPIIILNHALTGNSNLLDKKNGWWRGLIGDEKLFDTSEYTILVFNFLGNGYDGTFIEKYKDFNLKDVARTWMMTLESLKVNRVYAMIGGSLGGSLAWEFATLKSNFLEHLVPIATDKKPSNWLLAFTHAQESILLNSNQSLSDARKMAMLFYRNPNSIARKFENKKSEQIYPVESWLNFHGERLKDRYSLKSYLMMNHLMRTMDVGLEELKRIDSKVTQIGVSSDFLYPKDEMLKTKLELDELNIENDYFEIKSFDGHDAFLIEQKQITKILTHLF